jgi:AbrB family looped-hinge helix DNA binding protein
MATTHLRGKGQVTIPVSLRRELDLKEDSALSLVKVGGALFLVPKALEGDGLARKTEAAMKKNGLSLEGLLKDLRGARRAYARERYGA